MSGTQLEVGHATHVGMKRSQNQDSIAVHPELGLFVVADGMGGHQGGETASRMVVETLPRALQEEGPSRESLKHAVEKASHLVFERASHEPSLQGMGTTTVALLMQDGVATIAHVGDSRCYLVREGSIWQLTRDHSLVQEKLRAGLISRAELKTDRMKNVITRSVGFEANVAVELYEAQARAGDLFLLCSDGLSGLVEDGEILALAQASGNAQARVQALIERANQNGGDDNISTILIEVH